MASEHAWERYGTLDDWLARPAVDRLRLSLLRFLGMGYSANAPRVPFWPHQQFPESLVEPFAEDTNCSTMTAAVVMAAYPTADWVRESYGRLQVFAGEPPDAPIQEAVRVGIASERKGFAAWSWHLVQGWSRLPGDKKGPRGHAFFVFNWDPRKDQGVMVHASSVGRAGPRLEPVNLTALRRKYPAGLFIGSLRMK